MLSKTDIQDRPKVVCLCGSTRLLEAFQDANLNETLKGHIVLTIGCDVKTDHQLFGPTVKMKTVKDMFDNLHLWKIYFSDEILVLNVGGYIGESTRREIEYAQSWDKPIRYLEEPCK